MMIFSIQLWFYLAMRHHTTISRVVVWWVWCGVVSYDENITIAS